MVGKSEGEYDTGQKSMMIKKKHLTVSEQRGNGLLDSHYVAVSQIQAELLQ